VGAAFHISLSLDEFLRRPQREDGEREELIQGELILSPPAKAWHADIVRRLRRKLARLEEEGYAIVNDSSCILGKESMPAPDLAIVNQDRWQHAVANESWLEGSMSGSGFSTASGFTSAGTGTLNAPLVPEPAPAAMLLGGLATVIVTCRRRSILRQQRMLRAQATAVMLILKTLQRMAPRAHADCRRRRLTRLAELFVRAQCPGCFASSEVSPWNGNFDDGDDLL
jgi:hypothetical protein